jgi:peptide methionine sulfoxide reductase msrA/msrB
MAPRDDWQQRRVLTWVTVALCAAAVLVLARPGRSSARAGTAPPERTLSRTKYARPAAEQLRRLLTPLQFEITQREGTEPPFDNAFWDNHQPGLYVDVATGEPLFSSTDKFESGTGWPSFTRPVEGGRVVERRDSTLGIARVEVRSSGGDSHLGHVFDDGPAPIGLRYCINSAALRFVPAAKLDSAGYGAYRPLFGDGAPAKPATAALTAPSTKPTATPPPPVARETAILAGGCFWGMEEILRKVPGVIATDVGYAGGGTPDPNYEEVHTGITGHAEAVRVVFDPRQLSYADLLEKWFFRMHDPTTRDRQGNDVGTQYRSAIFVTSPRQREVAEAAKARAGKSGRWKNPIVTEIVAAGPFTAAEAYHQKYLASRPDGYTCHFLRD